MIRIEPALSAIGTKSEMSGREQVRLLLRILRLALPIWDKILLRIILGQFGAFIAVVPILMSAYIIDEVLVGGDVGQLGRCVILLIAVHLFGQFLSVMSTAILTYLDLRVGLDLKLRFYRHIQGLSLRFYESRPVGEHMYRCDKDIDGVVYMVTRLIPDLLQPIQQLFAFALLLALVDTWMILPATVYLIVYFTIRQVFTTRLRKWDFKIRASTQRLDAILRELLTATKITQGYGRENTARRWFGAELFSLSRAVFQRAILFGFDSTFGRYAWILCIFCITIPTGFRVIDGTLSLGDYYIVFTIFGSLVNPIIVVIKMFQGIRLMLVPAERMVATLDLDPEIADPASGRKLEVRGGHVELRSVSFAYDDVPVLQDMSIEVKPGEKVALVGASGSGKSTVAKLLLRLYDTQEGQVLIDGVDVRDVTRNSLRQSIGFVAQDSFLFAETLRDNIRYGRPDADDDAVLRAAELAQVAEFAEELPERYDTELGEGGTLSGGQRQRVCIARALVRDSSILVFDEATSALDPITELAVTQAVDEAFAGRTRIIIAHNLATVSDSDRIYVLSHGRVAETGTHDELMQRKGAYYGLWFDENSSNEEETT